MAKTAGVLILVGTLASSHAAFAAPVPRSSAPVPVSVAVVRSCGVFEQASGKVGVRCTRGAADRVLVSSAEPRVVTLQREGAQVKAVVDADARSDATGERFLTLQF